MMKYCDCLAILARYSRFGLLVLVCQTKVLLGVEIDVRESQLFLDDEIIEATTLVERIMHQPIRHSANPLLAPEKPWEGPTMNYLGGVFKDEKSGLFRAWYVGVVAGGVPDMPKIYYPICTIQSKDGIHWERPQLDTHADLTGCKNNIVLHIDRGCTAAPNIIYDSSDPAEPWKLIIHHSIKSPCHYYVRLATSADGLHWKWKTTPEDQVYAKLHDRMTAMLDPDNSEFPYYLLGRSSISYDYPLLYPNRIRVREVFQTRMSGDGKTISHDPVPALRPDVEDPPATEFYHMSTFRYESLYLGLLMIYHRQEPPTAEVQLVTSRDLEHWERVRPRLPFIASHLPEGRQQGIWDAAGIQPNLSPPILHNGALWFYYYGGPVFHGSRHMKGQFQLGVALLRPDGYASLRAGWRTGEITTKPFKWPGGKLIINGQTLGGSGAPESWIKTAILDPAGNTIEGFSEESSDPITGDFPEGEPQWSKEPQNLDSLIGKTIRLRFFVHQAELFSFKSLPSGN